MASTPFSHTKKVNEVLKISSNKARLHGFAAWFDVIFESHLSRGGDKTKEQPIVLSTAPTAPYVFSPSQHSSRAKHFIQ